MPHFDVPIRPRSAPTHQAGAVRPVEEPRKVKAQGFVAVCCSVIVYVDIVAYVIVFCYVSVSYVLIQ